MIPKAGFTTNLSLANLSLGIRLPVTTTVDVSEKPAVTTIVRGGAVVTPPPVDKGLVDDFLGHLVPITRDVVPRVLQQSVAHGTLVAKGTSVDLVLVPPTDIQVGVLAGAH